MSKLGTESSVPVKDIEIFNDIRNYVRRKINNVEDNFFGDDYAVQRLEVLKLIKRSVETGESNSVIICGPPGCGKTALLNNILKELKSSEFLTEENSLIVRLNGLLHTDDRLALQDIRRQLKVKECDSSKIFSSFQENLMYLLDKIRENGKTATLSPCTLFILDEFHLFCKHKNQILLYNLFDICQTSKASLCVIGLTCYTDIMDFMEKRVLSRFSHRIIWMVENITFEGRLKLFADIFTLHAVDLPNIDEMTYEIIECKEVHSVLKKQLEIDPSQTKLQNLLYKLFNTITFELHLLNANIKNVFTVQDVTNEIIECKEVHSVIKKQLEIDPSQTKFRNLLYKLFNTITFELPLLNSDNIKNVFTVQDVYTSILTRLSLLEMALVIAVKHQTVNYEREPFNFEMIYNQYLKFSSRNATNLVTERSVVLKAFQRLQELEIIVPLAKTIGNALGKVPLEYQLYNLNLTEEQIAEGVKLNKDLTTELRQWAVYSV